jgi:hypothetical protein
MLTYIGENNEIEWYCDLGKSGGLDLTAEYDVVVTYERAVPVCR